MYGVAVLMPIKSECLFCKKEILLVIKRDLSRKKYCSHSCRQKFRASNGEYSIEYMREKMWSKCNTKEANLKKGHPGEKNPRFLKDRSKVKHRPRYEMSIWRKSVFERDNYTCVMCNKRGVKIQADHILPYSCYPEKRWELSNGRTLCVECHKNTDTYGAKSFKLKKELEYVKVGSSAQVVTR